MKLVIPLPATVKVSVDPTTLISSLLNDCPLTLDELDKIIGTVDGNTGMLAVLRGIYHIRIEYPDDANP